MIDDPKQPATAPQVNRWNIRPAKEPRLVFVDIELARVKRRRCIVQIAAIAVTRSCIERERFEAKIRIDENYIPSQLIRKRHFSPQRWREEARHPKAVAYDFARFLGRHATSEIAGANRRRLLVAQLVAHNGAFDGPFLHDWFERLGLYFPASYRTFCTMHRALWLFHEFADLPPPRDFKLGTLCDYFRVPFAETDAHDALADVRATVELYRRMTMLEAARHAERGVQSHSFPAETDVSVA